MSYIAHPKGFSVLFFAFHLNPDYFRTIYFFHYWFWQELLFMDTFLPYLNELRLYGDREVPNFLYRTLPKVRFSSCQRNLIKTFQIEGMIALITKMTLIFSSDLLNGQK